MACRSRKDKWSGSALPLTADGQRPPQQCHHAYDTGTKCTSRSQIPHAQQESSTELSRLVVQRSQIYHKEKEADFKSCPKNQANNRSPKPNDCSITAAKDNTTGKTSLTDTSPTKSEASKVSTLFHRLLHSPRRSERRSEAAASAPSLTSIDKHSPSKHRSKQPASELRRAFSLRGSRDSSRRKKRHSVLSSEVARSGSASDSSNYSPGKKKLVPRSPCSGSPLFFLGGYQISKLEDECSTETLTSRAEKTQKGESTMEAGGLNQEQKAAYSNTGGGALDRRESVQEWVNSLPQDGTLARTGAVRPASTAAVTATTTAAAGATTAASAEEDAATALGAGSLLPSCDEQTSVLLLDDDLNLGAEAKMMDGESQQQMRGDRPALSASQGGRVSLQHRLQLLQQHRQDSFNSEGSKYESVNEILRDRQGNPEEILTSLGFGSHESDGSHYSRIPDRFLFSKKHSKSSMMEEFLVRNPDIRDYMQLSAVSRDSLPEEGQGQCEGTAQGQEGSPSDQTSRKSPGRSFSSVARTVALLTRFAGSAQTMQTLHSVPSLLVSQPSQDAGRSHPGPTEASRRFRSILNPENRKFLVRQGLYDSESEPENSVPGVQKMKTFSDVVDAVRIKKRLSIVDENIEERLPGNQLTPLVMAGELLRRASSGSITEGIRAVSPNLSAPLSPHVSAPGSPCPSPVGATSVPDRFLNVGSSSLGGSAVDLNACDIDSVREMEDVEKDSAEEGFDLSLSVSSEDFSPVVLPRHKAADTLAKATEEAQRESDVKLEGGVTARKEDNMDYTTVEFQGCTNSEPLAVEGKRGELLRDANQNEVVVAPTGAHIKLAHLQDTGIQESFEMEEIQSADMVQDELPSFGQTDRLRGCLVRTGSTQSDSSGFAESDALETALEPDWNTLRVAHLGSSAESESTGSTVAGSIRWLSQPKSLKRQRNTDVEDGSHRPPEMAKCFTDVSRKEVTLVDRSEMFLVLDRGEVKHMVSGVSPILSRRAADEPSVKTDPTLPDGEHVKHIPRSNSDVASTTDSGVWSMQKGQGFIPSGEDKCVSRLQIDIQHTPGGEVYCPMESLDGPQYQGHPRTARGHPYPHYYDQVPPAQFYDPGPGYRSWHWAHECSHQKWYYPPYYQSWDPPGDQWPMFGTSKAITKQHLVEEAKLMQHALQKYKLEFRALEIRAKRAQEEQREHLSREERESLDVVCALRGEVAKEISEMERLLSVRMRTVIAGNEEAADEPPLDLASLHVIQQMIELLKEQVYHANLVNSLSGELDGAPSHPLLVELHSISIDHDDNVQHYGGTSIMEQLMLLQKQIEAQQCQTASTLTMSFRELRSTLLEEIRSSIHAETQHLKMQVTATENDLQSLRRTINNETMSQTPETAV